MLKVVGLARFPVKGLGGETLESTPVLAGLGFPGDRIFGFRLTDRPPLSESKHDFAQGLNHPELACLRVRYRESPPLLAISSNKRLLAEIEVPAEAPRLEAAITEFLRDKTGRITPLQLLRGRYPDEPAAHVSILTLASLRALEAKLGRPVEVARLRMNLLLDDPVSTPWWEFEQVGRVITIGTARLRIEARLPRCRAPDANPTTGERDLHLVRTLRTEFGHEDLGVLATVVQDGHITLGDECR